MATVISGEPMIGKISSIGELGGNAVNLAEAEIDTKYCIKDIKTNDDELKNFLFTLGCYKGESVTVISVLAENYVINIKDARYSIDEELAKAIII